MPSLHETEVGHPNINPVGNSSEGEKASGIKDDLHTSPRDVDWRFPAPDEIREELAKEFTTEQKDKAWTEAAEAVKTYYDDLLRRWKEELDTLLVYAGVSSAVLTAFNVESYHLLQPDPTDPTVAVLKQISAQLVSFTVTSPFVNSTSPVHAAIQAPFHPPASAVWLNTLWFSSLVFSLASALLALFVKQWLYEATIGGTSHESARLRQYRLNGLLKWRVGTIVVVLPIMLQLASTLFLVGLLVLLWTLHSTVAAVTSAIVVALFVFFLVVTILPVFKADCAYRSPASLAIYAILRHSRNVVMQTLRRICRVADAWYNAVECGVNSMSPVRTFAYQDWDVNMPTWHGRDQNLIYSQRGALDRRIMTTAYTTTTDTKFLTCMPMTFPDLPSEQVVQCFADLRGFEVAEWGQVNTDLGSEKDSLATSSLVMYGLRHMLARPDSDRFSDAWIRDLDLIAINFMCPGSTYTERYAELACKTLCQLAVEEPSTYIYFFHMHTVLRYLYEEHGARHSCETLAHIRAALEQPLSSWDYCGGWDGFMHYVIAVHWLLHCVHVVISGCSPLSPAQTDSMLAWGQRGISRVCERLRDFRWQGLHAGCVSGTQPGEQTCILTFPHLASEYFITQVIDPVMVLCSTAEGLEMVSNTDLVSSIQLAWSSARSAYPHAVEIVDGNHSGFVWCSGLDRIDEKLEALRVMVGKGLKV